MASVQAYRPNPEEVTQKTAIEWATGAVAYEGLEHRPELAQTRPLEMYNMLHVEAQEEKFVPAVEFARKNMNLDDKDEVDCFSKNPLDFDYYSLTGTEQVAWWPWKRFSTIGSEHVYLFEGFSMRTAMSRAIDELTTFERDCSDPWNRGCKVKPKKINTHFLTIFVGKSPDSVSQRKVSFEETCYRTCVACPWKGFTDGSYYHNRRRQETRAVLRLERFNKDEWHRRHIERDEKDLV
ncbi:uncharacterized protein B0I36DRAFT_351554 [Microdochium trichocladiopsis]|uniref:Uncharacterized protein n=1 Tax=Microdochium trichocladiopsis TaxID=1682393 RepID=A0A9P9BLI8_9PEZI|nr:uncharacterized protein B0I36DRAFT_351554 [Microdochium trichocladiopsis]KAH7028132.1 hypothetical protein B0I36DRAFT_351554 [Microdochium trichocladiopsis]